MSLADGVMTATAHSAAYYAQLNPRTFLCRNGIDSGNWELRPRSRDERVVIGWHGNPLEHMLSVPLWLPAVANVLERHPEVEFVTIGVAAFADELAQRFGGRCRGSGPVPLVDYAAKVNEMDVILAPAAHTEMLRGKPDQRWLTAGALGKPIVADPWIYPDVRDGDTGLLAVTAGEAETALERLVTDQQLRHDLGSRARAEIQRTRDMSVVVGEWHRAFDAVFGRTDRTGWSVRDVSAADARKQLLRFWYDAARALAA
jgi:glycosyltransferase involved in cell wall biosynthesis